jgi:hypothetical protein
MTYAVAREIYCEVFGDPHASRRDARWVAAIVKAPDLASAAKLAGGPRSVEFAMLIRDAASEIAGGAK